MVSLISDWISEVSANVHSGTRLVSGMASASSHHSLSRSSGSSRSGSPQLQSQVSSCSGRGRQRPSTRSATSSGITSLLPVMEIEDVPLIDLDAPSTPNVSEVISRHVLDLGRDGKGQPLEPPCIPMCRLVHMELVRSLQKDNDSIVKLKESFTTVGYSPGFGSKFYVQPCDVNGVVLTVTNEQRDGWDEMWREVDLEFERECDEHPAFHVLKDKMFAVFDGNHRLFSWMQVAALYPDSRKYHPRVMCTILKGDKGSLIEIETAMHTLNK